MLWIFNLYTEKWDSNINYNTNRGLFHLKIKFNKTHHYNFFLNTLLAKLYKNFDRVIKKQSANYIHSVEFFYLDYERN